jgi:hypothetical protein
MSENEGTYYVSTGPEQPRFIKLSDDLVLNVDHIVAIDPPDDKHESAFVHLVCGCGKRISGEDFESILAILGFIGDPACDQRDDDDDETEQAEKAVSQGTGETGDD